MKDNIVVIRPPSEAESFLLPVTIGCSHNKCTFCSGYIDTVFRLRATEDIKEHIDIVAGGYGPVVRRVFLENGDALVAPQQVLVEVLEYLRRSFPNLERVGTYATPKSALLKTPGELKKLRELGLKIAYLGAESGDDDVLKAVNKGATRAQIVEAGRKLKQAGITTSVTVILGLAGPGGSERHAIATGKILTELDPDYTGALTLMLVPGTPLYRELEAGRFEMITPFDSLVEMKLIVENSNFTGCFFTANHASNYLPIRASLPQQKAELLALLNRVIAEKDVSRLKPEYFRAL